MCKVIIIREREFTPSLAYIMSTAFYVTVRVCKLTFVVYSPNGILNDPVIGHCIVAPKNYVHSILLYIAKVGTEILKYTQLCTIAKFNRGTQLQWFRKFTR